MLTTTWCAMTLDVTLVSNVDLLRCNFPGCYLVVSSLLHWLISFNHIVSFDMLRFVEKPAGGWFCDDDCKRNVSFRVGGRKCH